jgi:membrane protease YdiL (CAAX protease family)
MLALGALHVLTELAFSEATAHGYNAAVSVAVIGYLVWRGRHSRGALRAWGMRRDNFAPALRAQLLFATAAAAALIGYGLATDSLYLPRSFWFTVALYPVWGVAQQFALQNLIARNLTGLLSRPAAVAAVAALLFGAAHYPRLDLLLLTLVAGFFLTLQYRRQPNLWAVGIVHGIVGSLAVYIVLREDPGAALLRMIGF